METATAANLVNLLGFLLGVALYGLLLVMVVRYPIRTAVAAGFEQKFHSNRLLLATGALGLLWNAGEFISFALRDFGATDNVPILSAVAYAALGFLPAVVVHSAVQSTTGDRTSPPVRLIMTAAYLLSGAGAFVHFYALAVSSRAASLTALNALTGGYLVLLAALFLVVRQTLERKTIWAAALAIFAISALHLGQHTEETRALWLIELVGHQASLPLAFAILFGNFRFAFADLFLKRALSLLLLTLLAFGLYSVVAAPLIRLHEGHGADDSQAAAVLLALWVATALVYSKLHNFAVWFVDAVLLRRADYAGLQVTVAERIANCETAAAVLDAIGQQLSTALTARRFEWRAVGGEAVNLPLLSGAAVDARRAEVFISTVELPHYALTLRDFVGGRQLLSAEIELLETIALIASRRIDTLRVLHERCEHEFRQQEIGKLATEAELRALRAQINPHFLFNALTTIGYLIQTAPDRAFETLMLLTKLLRGTLKNAGEFVALGDELRLVEAYLEIERARFEERLTVEFDVSPELEKLKIPGLILQPLVENAVKHGIAPKRAGGRVSISVKLTGQSLILTVADTGAGFIGNNAGEPPPRGIGLTNIEQRLKNHYGAAASLTVTSNSGQGITAAIELPINTISKTVGGDNRR